MYDLSQPLHLQFRLTARTALAVSMLAAAALMLTLYLLFRDQHQSSYWLIIQSLTRGQDQLAIAMWIGGIVILLVAGLMIWFIMLYSSARIAGPLYRFARNVEMQIEAGPVQIVQLRKADYLQDLSAQMAATVDELDQYHAAQRSLLDEIDQRLQSQAPDGYDELMQQLQACAKRK